ncbi:winged helix-turn-helix domain-containing protein [Streptomyces collinus]|uniref:helix-turn-helix domain-containing protein n=1 Tax=Streptomyces collinus TaxID=42684 RepID=UPI0036EEAA90
MEAVERFRQGDENPVIAHDLRVSELLQSGHRSGDGWVCGELTLQVAESGQHREIARPRGLSLKKLSVRSVQRWRRAWSQNGPGALASKGPASLPLLSGIKTHIGRRFHKSYTVQGVAALLKRHGWSCQVPARRAVERDEAAVAGWVKETWPSVE